MKRISQTFSLDLNMISRMQELADRSNKNLSELAREAFSKYLDELEEKLNQPAVSMDEAASRG